MKTIKLIYPLTLALAVTLAGAGCKHQPAKLTQLPASPEASVGEPSNPPTIVPTPTQPPVQPQPINPLPPSQPFTPEPPVTTTPTPPPAFQDTNRLATSDDWLPENYVADRAALAANTVHFAFDSAVVRTDEQANLQAVAAALTSDPNVKLMIEGNCDERGTEEYNRSLGERRALALREELAKLNIDPKRIRTISYGKDKPVDTERTEAAYAKNRRGDFVLYHPKTGV